MEFLYWIQDRLNKMTENPITLGVSIVVLSSWMLASFLSGNKFDPNLVVENIVVNSLGLILMFSACSKNSQTHKALQEHHDSLHEKLEDLHDKIDKMS